MSDKEEIIHNISSHYSVQVMKAFDNIELSSNALQAIARALKEIYRYFEPSFFNGDFFVCKNLYDAPCFDESRGTPLYDKNILLNRTDGLIIIQIFGDNTKMILWEAENPDDLIKQKNTLVYHFNLNKEFFFANENKIDITAYDKGSRFATQYTELVLALQQYAVSKIFHSSCPHFSKSWSDQNKLFFKGGGRGNNIPEMYMQISLEEFLSTYIVRGITTETSREFNLLGDMTNPKPVDIKIHWTEANRIALIEVKFIGTVKKDDGELYSRLDARANEGIVQLKGYHDRANTDSPTTILKSYLVVIDGRRNNLKKDSITINQVDGMYYKDKEINIDDDKRFHTSIQGFEKPIRMFAVPICS